MIVAASRLENRYLWAHIAQMKQTVLGLTGVAVIALAALLLVGGSGGSKICYSDLIGRGLWCVE